MQKYGQLLVLALLISTLAVQPTFAGCDPGGYCTLNLGPPCFNQYNYLSNSDFSSSCAWTYTHATRTNESTGCISITGYHGKLTYTGNGFAHLAHIQQQLHIPASNEAGFISSSTTWSIGVQVHIGADDRSHQSTLKIRIYDLDTAQTLYLMPTIYADTSNDCAQYGNNFTANLNGRNIVVDAFASFADGYNLAVFDVDNIELVQNVTG
jgi:hypothetical protein